MRNRIHSRLGCIPPGVFLAPPNFAADLSCRHADPELLVASLEQVWGTHVHAANRRTVKMIFEALPATAYVSHTGIFQQRKPTVIHLIIACVRNTDLGSVFGWTGLDDLENPAKTVVAEFADLTLIFRLALEVADGSTTPRIGLEMLPRKAGFWQVSDILVWHDFVDRLEQRQWCHSEKAAGLRTGGGAQVLFTDGRSYTVRRRIHHIKLTVQSDTTTAKAYVTFTLTPGKRGLAQVRDAP